jgi:hypothetical protein
LKKTGGTGTSNFFANYSDLSNINRAPGTVLISTGTLEFDGSSNTFNGAISGAGTLAFDDGISFISVNPTISNFLIDGGSVSFSNTLTYAGNFLETGGSLAGVGATMATTPLMAAAYQAMAQRNVAAPESRTANIQCTAAFSNAPSSAPTARSQSFEQCFSRRQQYTDRTKDQCFDSCNHDAHRQDIPIELDGYCTKTLPRLVSVALSIAFDKWNSHQYRCG